MVSQPEASSRDRLVAAAQAEFAARGFDGAKVDRIAARARVNKAMLYYHFASKAGLYREILRALFASVAAAVAAVRDTGAPADRQLAAFIAAINDTALANPHFPGIWLREIADGGRHLDDGTVTEMARVLETLGAILADGRRAGHFGDAHPFIVHLGIVGPLLLATATEPIRARFGDRAPVPIRGVPRAAVVAHVEATTLAAIAAGRRVPDRSSSASRRRRS